MENKTIAYWLIVSLALVFVGGVLDGSDNYYMLVGTLWMAFTVVAIVRLFKLK